MVKIFLDTNILLDYLIDERPGNPDGKQIIKLLVSGEFEGYVSPISLINIFYSLRSQRTEQERKDIIESFMDILNIIEIDFDIMQLALYVPIADYEDGLQYIYAQKASVDYIITGDVKFREYDLELKRVSAADFIRQSPSD